MVKPQSIFITGSSGFIGKSLQEHMNSTNYCNYSVSPNLINEEFNTDNLNNIDQVIHLFGVFGNDLEQLSKVNVMATHLLMKRIIGKQIKKIIYLSSGAVYGELTHNHISIESDLLNPNTHYGLTKMLAEEIIKAYCEAHNIKYVILRLPNVYGGLQTKGVIFNFLQQIKLNSNVTIEGNGNQKRDFLHISDLLNAIDLALEYSGSSVTLNISSKNNLSINELIKLFKDYYDFDVSYVEKRNNITNLNLNFDRAQQVLGYEPRVNEILFEK